MSIQLWTISNLQRLDYSIRKKIVFYAPLTESLDFYGVDPATFTRAGTSTRTGRDGGSYSVAANVPRFSYSGENALGLALTAGEALSFNAANNLNSANTLVWFEQRVPKSTPTQTNPFDSGGSWTGNLNIQVSHIAKANAVLANSEINAIQAALLDVVQTIPAPPEPPVGTIGVFVSIVPSGAINGVNTVFTLPSNPDLNSLLVFAHGAGAMWRVANTPGTLEYTAGGVGNRTITMGLAPSTDAPFFVNYVVSA